MPAPSPESPALLRVRGAHEHNLRHVDLDLPRERLIVVTGVSGSGKSSLAFDTLFREGQRRYLETFPSYARQLLGKLERPAVDHIRGLSPALAVDQRSCVRSPRSTVGTLSELLPLLRLLYARAGEPHCARCGEPLAAVSPETLATLLDARYAGRAMTLYGPIVDGHAGAHREPLERAAAEGYAVARIDGRHLPLVPTPSLDPALRHQIELPVAELGPDRPQGALRAAVERALRVGRGVVKILCDGELARFAPANACASCGAPTPEIGPRLFSFNSPYGACPSCQGLGVTDAVDPALLVGDSSKSLRDGALVVTTPSGYLVYSQVTIEVLDQICRAHGFSVDVPWDALTAEQQHVVLYGSDRLKVPFGKHPLESRLRWKGIPARPRQEGTYPGIVPTIEAILRRSRNDNALRFVRSRPCTACGGARLRPEALAVRLGGRSIAELGERPIDQLGAALESLELDGPRGAVAASLRDAIAPRLETLRALGLGYLTLARESTSLSAGEAQRVRLATQLHSGLGGLLYVLDEPSVGLHPRETRRLLDVLGRLRDQGNTVLVVEHDEEVARAADFIVDIGPGAGRQGGEIVYAGPADGYRFPARPPMERAPLDRSAPTLWLRGARHHNLRHIDVPFRLGAMNVVVGVSGAGKSSLVVDTLARELRRRLHGACELPGAFEALDGAEALDKVVEIDQAPIGRTPRSNPATYTGLFDSIRGLFAATAEARARGWGKGRFSFNVAGGRCELCGGAGVQSIGMHFLADVEVRCEQCGGRRFNDETLGVTWHGLSIGDVLELTVGEALEAWGGQEIPGQARRLLEAMSDVGLGYLTLGQPATTLSGGEAQRVKLAAALGRAATGRTLYLLDEPTTGLHTRDVEMLLRALGGLVARGNTVVAIDHHPDLLAAAAWEIELGPDAGERGGQLVYAGPARPAPEPVAPYRPARREPRERGIRLRGVTTHNLKGIDLDLPAGRLTVVTGPSGSGKSSLAFDTLYCEAERRFSDSLASHVRRHMPRARPAALALGDGLSPAIAVGQHVSGRSPRSTVGTLTEIYDDLRLLFSRAAVACCARCHIPLEAGRCPRCQAEAPERLSARMFSFNHAAGSCPRCRGLGLVLSCDPEALVRAPDRSLFDGALAGSKAGDFYGDPHGQHLAILTAVGQAHGVDFHRPWSELDARARELAMFGTGTALHRATWRSGTQSVEAEQVWDTPWRGFVGYVDEEYQRKHADDRAEALLPLMLERVCDECGGTRLAPRPRAARLGGHTIAEICALPLFEARALLDSLPAGRVVDAARAEACRRLEALCEAGLDYLSLDRRAATLSGGESARLRLARQLDGGLRGVTYVLDEPTVGLHPRDTARLLGVLRRLRDDGNTLVVVEHDADVMRAADHLVDLGPGSGANGGEIVAVGSLEEICSSPRSATGRYLRDRAAFFPPRSARNLGPGIAIEGASAHNLQLDCEIPAGGRIALTGVSGSGKTSLLFDVLCASAERGAPVACRSIRGLERFEQVLFVDQAPVASGGSSTPATTMGLFDAIRDLFAAAPLARARGWRRERFSLAKRGGRCEACQGAGRIEVRLDFLPDLWLPCEACRGERFAPDTLEVVWRAKNIAEVLALTVAEARHFFAGQPRLARPLAILDEAGLDYVALGQPVRTLSGGEATRLRLAAELWRGESERPAPARGKSRSPRLGARAASAERPRPKLLLFDEPTTGLHPLDVARLLALLDRLVGQGHTVVVVEHNLDVVRTSDFVIDLGPGAGPRGGRLVAAGPPELIARAGESATGQALRALGA